MPSFLSAGIEIAYDIHGEGNAPILLIHGFGSSGQINWVNTGWVEALKQAGYRPITMDNRGHGRSRKVYDPKLYLAHEMADDAARLLDHLELKRMPVIGFSMGARIASQTGSTVFTLSLGLSWAPIPASIADCRYKAFRSLDQARRRKMVHALRRSAARRA